MQYRRAVRDVLILLAATGALTVTVVLPAEKGIDPTGVGRLIGLTQMGQIKVDNAQQAVIDSADAVADSTFVAASRHADSLAKAEEARVIAAVQAGAPVARTDTTILTILAGEERSVRLQMTAAKWAVYSWSATGGSVDYDVRGDSAGAPAWWYHRYERGVSQSSKSGALVAKFSGTHGWHWQNDNAAPVRITLVTRGDYTPMRTR